jgi:hypothetical protein
MWLTDYVFLSFKLIKYKILLNFLSGVLPKDIWRCGKITFLVLDFFLIGMLSFFDTNFSCAEFFKKSVINSITLKYISNI